jgi:hypothetical protein
MNTLCRRSQFDTDWHPKGARGLGSAVPRAYYARFYGARGDHLCNCFRRDVLLFAVLAGRIQLPYSVGSGGSVGSALGTIAFVIVTISFHAVKAACDR